MLTVATYQCFTDKNELELFSNGTKKTAAKSAADLDHPTKRKIVEVTCSVSNATEIQVF